jgi:hypothetical protein
MTSAFGVSVAAAGKHHGGAETAPAEADLELDASNGTSVCGRSIRSRCDEIPAGADFDEDRRVL